MSPWILHQIPAGLDYKTIKGESETQFEGSVIGKPCSLENQALRVVWLLFNLNLQK